MVAGEYLNISDHLQIHCSINRKKNMGLETLKSLKLNSQFVSHWGSLSCRWWPGWKSKPRCTRGHCHSEWSCWWTRCKYCWCSRHSCSYPSPSLRFQTPTQKWNLIHCDPGEAHQTNEITVTFIIIQTLTGIQIGVVRQHIISTILSPCKQDIAG